MSKRVANKGRARTGSGKPWARSTSTRPSVVRHKRFQLILQTMKTPGTGRRFERFMDLFNRMIGANHRGKK